MDREELERAQAEMRGRMQAQATMQPQPEAARMFPTVRPVVDIVSHHSRKCPHQNDSAYHDCNCWTWILVKGAQPRDWTWKATRQRTLEGAERFKRDYLSIHYPPPPPMTETSKLDLILATVQQIA
jgi:hypothetical protein